MRALARFHAGVGARLALLAAAPLAAAPVIAILLQQDPSAAVRHAAGWLVGAPASASGGLALAAACLALASWAAPRIAVGHTGWLRHLPLTETARRRAALLGAAVAQSPVVIAAALLLPLAAAAPRGVAFARLAGLPLTCVAAALAAWPRAGWRARSLAVLALPLLATAHAGALAAAVPLLVLSDRLCDRPAPLTTVARRPSRLPASLLIAARALGPGALEALLPALLPLAAMTALRVNNDLAPGVARGAARFGGAFAAVFLLAGLAERLAVRRPVWAWARSLPSSAARRVTEDALLLGACGLVPVALTAALDPVAALQVAGGLPALAFYSAGAIHPRDERQRSVAGQVLAAGAFLASGLALCQSSRCRRSRRRRSSRAVPRRATVDTR